MAKHGGLAEFTQSLFEYVEDLITESPKESFSKIEILILLNAVKNDADLLAMMEAWDHAVQPRTYNG